MFDRSWQMLAGALDSRRATLVLFAGFLLSRLLILLVAVEPTSDAIWYYSKAAEIAAGLGYQSDGKPTAFWPVGYPAGLAAAFKLLGTSVPAAQTYNIVLVMLTAWLVFRTIEATTSSRVAANVGLLILLCYPNHAAYVALVVSECQYTFLIVLATYITCTRQGAFWAGALGITLGAAMLTKPQTLLLLPFMLGALWYRTERWPRVSAATIRQAAVCLLMLVAVVAPWSLRNLSVFGQFVLVSTNGGVTLAGANNPNATGNYEHEVPWPDQIARGVLGELERDQRAKALATEWIRQNPGSFVALMPKKLWSLWVPDGEAEWAYQADALSYNEHRLTYRTIRWMNQFFYASVMMAYAVVVWRTLRLGRMTSALEMLAHSFVLVTSATALIFYGEPRYHYSAMPLVVMATVAHLSRRSSEATALTTARETGGVVRPTASDALDR